MTIPTKRELKPDIINPFDDIGTTIAMTIPTKRELKHPVPERNPTAHLIAMTIPTKRELKLDITLFYSTPFIVLQ